MLPVAARERAAADRRLFPLLLGALIAVAWLALAVWDRSPYGRYLGHHELSNGRDGGLLLAGVFVGGWLLMIVAMMLPTSLPLVLLFGRLTQQRRDRGRLLLLLLAGYLAAWTGFGWLVYAGDGLLHAVVARGAWLAANARFLGAATLLLAGLYQVTPVKYHCLDRCRSPISFLAQHWRGRAETAEAFRLGVRHGLFCLGCCWSLMLVMFAVGVGNVGWMLLLGAVMGAEKNLSWGRRLSAPLGAVLVAWGVATGFVVAGHG
jgi:predicted metal-binding membrane protein